MERDSFSIIDYEIEELRAKRLRDTQEVVRLASMKASYLADLYSAKSDISDDKLHYYWEAKDPFFYLHLEGFPDDVNIDEDEKRTLKITYQRGLVGTRVPSDNLDFLLNFHKVIKDYARIVGFYGKILRDSLPEKEIPKIEIFGAFHYPELEGKLRTMNLLDRIIADKLNK